MMTTALNEFQEQYYIGTILLVAGVGSGIIGWPLLLIKVNDFRLDIAYIVVPELCFSALVHSLHVNSQPCSRVFRAGNGPCWGFLYSP